MDNRLRILIIAALVFLSCGGIVKAEAPPGPPPGVTAQTVAPQPGVTARAAAPDAAQFQDWLKNNGQSQPPTSPQTLTQNSVAQSTPPPPPGMGKPMDLPQTVQPRPVKKYRARSTYAIPAYSEGEEPPEVLSPPISYRKSQEVMLRAAPPAGIPPNPDSGIAFNAMMQQNMPLTPQQVVRLRQLIDTSQRAASIPATIPPKPVSTTLMINLAPGATPPAIRLAQGYVTSLVFVDSTGAPWPLASYDIGDPKATNIQWDGKSNILLIQAAAPYGDSNLVIRLVGLPTPITLELVSGQRVVDYRTDIHVAGLGPNTKDLPIGTPLPNSANQLLLNILEGVAPAGSKQLTVKGGDCQAWLLGDKMYLRTRLTVLSPGWVGKMTSPDGMYAYEMQTSSSVLVSQYGNPIELKVEGF